MAATTTDGAPTGQTRSPLQELEDLLHCGICFDYFNIAMMIPQCSHNYCSLCIRKFLSYKTQCPTCCVAVTESELRNNRLLDDLVRTFASARKYLSQSLSVTSPQTPQDHSTGKLASSKRQLFAGKDIKQENKSMDTFLVKSSKKISNRSYSATDDVMDATLDGELSAPSSSTIKVKQEPGVMDQTSEEVSPPNTPSTSLAKVKVECPVCGVGILEQYINNHLDGCLTRDEKKESLRSSVQKRKPVAKVVYNLLSERDLRKRLKEVGLSTHGSKKQMIRRHQEFVHMYNAQCDSLHPKSAAEIVSEIEKNEKIRSALEAKKESGMTFTKEQSEEQIDEIHQDYRKKHKNEFQQLIEQVKGRWKTPKGKKVKVELTESDRNIDIISQKSVCRKVNAENSPNHQPLPEFVQDCSPEAEKSSVIRSSSPVFPLSPESRASDRSGGRGKKRKMFSTEGSSELLPSRSKRQRK
ncbi:E3 ubiquitin-protein ligase RAD18 isoform X3 [Hyla sarda]|uniref:E3 ubiquitin-protein ligase RAD18 isoform X3 n=1 Tax=Hyla sarda TaxID=327740 RepID=UPI0024C2EE0D|nr:E3 ubiquitin-protein ligase RAD18 isoform X3 [Hyla sarda]